MNNFERGQLIIPSNNLEIAFYYDPNNSELFEEIDYRVATDRERITYEKMVMSGLEPFKNYNAYVKSKSKQVDAIHKARTDETNKFRNLVNLHKLKGRDR